MGGQGLLETVAEEGEEGQEDEEGGFVYDEYTLQRQAGCVAYHKYIVSTWIGHGPN